MSISGYHMAMYVLSQSKDEAIETSKNAIAMFVDALIEENKMLSQTVAYERIQRAKLREEIDNNDN